MDTKIHTVLHSCYVKRLSRRQKKQEEHLGAVSASAPTLQRVRSKQGLRISKGNSDFNPLSSPWGLTPVINHTTTAVGSVTLPSHAVDLAWWVSLPWWVCFPRKISGPKALSPLGVEPPQFNSFKWVFLTCANVAEKSEKTIWVLGHPIILRIIIHLFQISTWLRVRIAVAKAWKHLEAEIQFCHSMAVWLWVRYLTYLSLLFHL